MKNFFSLAILAITSCMIEAQVGINTTNPQGVFNIDGAKDNVKTGIPTINQQANDFMVKSNGQTSIGTTKPSDYSMLTISSINTKNYHNHF